MNLSERKEPEGLRDDDGMEITLYKADGSVEWVRQYPSSRQVWIEHSRGLCGALCGFCYHEAVEWLEKNGMAPQS